MRIIILCVLTLWSLNPVSAQLFGKKKAAKTKTAKSKNSTIAQKTKGMESMPGIFQLYRDNKTGELWMKIDSAQLNKEFIHFTYTENGVISAGHHRGSYRGSRIITFKKRFQRIDIIQKNTSFYFDTTKAISKSAEANISNAVLASEKIEATGAAGFLISADKLFLDESLHRVNQSSRASRRGFGLGRLSKDKSSFKRIKNYPKNMDLVVEYVYDNPEPKGGGGEEVTDPRYVNILLQHSIIETPEPGFNPRREDYRIGYFTERVNDMTVTGFTNDRDLIHRWRLEKKNPDLAKSEPVEPITWWIENTTPISLRPIIKHAALEWNKAFEPLGFVNAIVVKEQSDTATWDAGDIRYNVLRWTSSPNPPFGGYGPSFVDPRTGEILGADIMLEYIFLTNRVRLSEVYNLPQNAHHCQASSVLHQETVAAKQWTNMMQLDSGEVNRLLYESLHYLILHEMGHTFGLNHNMKASQLNTPDELLDSERTYKNGLIGSVMDYPAINLPLNASQKVQFSQIEPGPYDKWAIEYGYSIALEDEKEEAQRLRQIALRSVMPENTFGNDADDMRSPGKATDPRVMIGDLSSDAIEYSVRQMNRSNELMSKLLDRYGHEQPNYEALVSSFNLLFGSTSKNAGIISRYIGGVYVERFEPGQIEDRKPYRAVPKAIQKKAMETLNTYVFSPKAMPVPDGLVYYLQRHRRGFDFFGRSELPSVIQSQLRVQQSVLDHLLHPYTLKRIQESHYVGNTYTLAEFMNDLSDAIFLEDLNASPSALRKSLQISYVTRLAKEIKTKRSIDNALAQTMYELLRIKEWMEAPVSSKIINKEEVQAHRAYILHLIEMSLDD